MSTNVVGVKLQSSGWCGSKRSSSGGSTISNALATPAPAASARARSTAKNACAWSGLNGSRSVCVSSDVGLELADQVGDADERVLVDLERVVAEVEARRSRRRGAAAARSASPWRISFTRSIGLPRLLPQLARLAALAVRERDDARDAAVRGRHRDRAAGAPDEVGRVRADHEHAPAHPATRLEPVHDHLPDLVVAEARAEQLVGPDREPVLDRRVVRVAEVAREEVVLEPDRADAVEDVLPRRLAAERRAEAALDAGSRARRARPGPRSRSSGTGTPDA